MADARCACWLQIVQDFKGKKLSANLPYKVEFRIPADDKDVKVIAHLVRTLKFSAVVLLYSQYRWEWRSYNRCICVHELDQPAKSYRSDEVLKAAYSKNI